MDPLLIGAATAVGVSSIGIKTWNSNRLKKLHKQKFRYVRILPHELISTDDQKVERFIDLFGGFNRTKIERFKKGRDWFRWLIHKDAEGNIAFYFGYPEDRTTGVMRSFLNAYPEAEVHKLSHEEVPLPKADPKAGYGGYFLPTKQGDQEGLPLKAFKATDDGMPDILSCLDAGEKDREVWLDIHFSPTSNRELKRVVKKAANGILGKNSTSSGSFDLEQFGREVFKDITSNGPTKSAPIYKSSTKTKDLDSDKQEQLKSLRRRFTGRESAFRVSIFLYVEGNYANSVAQTAATSIRKNLEYDNGLRFVKARVKEIGESAPIPSSRKEMIFTGQELANLLHFPTGTSNIYQYIPHLKKGQRSLKSTELTTGVSVGRLSHPIIKNRPVRIPKEMFKRHFVLSGQIGSGKSSEGIEMCQSLIDDWLEDPENAPGFSYMDPARETVLTLLTRLMKAEMDGKKVDWSKVHYVYLGPSDHSIGLNLLHKNEGEETDTIVSEILGLLKYAYGGDTPRMDRIVRNVLTTLVEDKQKHTILGIVPLLTNEDFRNRILPRVQHDSVIRQFWKTEFTAIEGQMDQVISPILNRLSPFTTNKTMRRMYGQAEWGLELKKYMDEGHIFLWDLLSLGEEQIKLTCGHLLNQIYKVAKTRGTGSKLHVVAVDEAHLVQIPIMKEMIFELRKFGICLGLITQFVHQFEPWLLDAISETVGTILTCTQGPKGAAALAQITAGHFDKTYFQKLPDRIVAVYTKEKGEDGRNHITSCVVEADPPYVYMPDGRIADYTNQQEMRKAFDWALEKGRELQKRDGRAIEEVDKEIDRYLETGTALQEVAAAAGPKRLDTLKDMNVPSLHRNIVEKEPEVEEEKNNGLTSWDDY